MAKTRRRRADAAKVAPASRAATSEGAGKIPSTGGSKGGIKRGKLAKLKQPVVARSHVARSAARAVVERRADRAPTVVKVHAAKTNLSKLLQRVAGGGRVFIAIGHRDPGFELVEVRPRPVHSPARRFGALRGVVEVDQRFFEPLPAVALAAWEG